MTLLYFLLYFNWSQNYDTVKILNSVFLLYFDISTIGGKIQIFSITYVNFLDSHQRIPWLSKGWTPLWGGIEGGFMTHNGRTHSHMVTVLPRPERHSTVIPRPVPPRWTRKKRTRKATVPPFPQPSDRSEHNSTWHNQGLFTAPLLGRKRHLTARRSSPRAHEPDVSVLRTCSLWGVLGTSDNSTRYSTLGTGTDTPSVLSSAPTPGTNPAPKPLRCTKNNRSCNLSPPLAIVHNDSLASRKSRAGVLPCPGLVSL